MANTGGTSNKFEEIVKAWVVKDYYNPRIKSEVILDTLLSERHIYKISLTNITDSVKINMDSDVSDCLNEGVKQIIYDIVGYAI